MKDAILNLKNSNAAVLDNIPAELLKQNAKITVEFMSPRIVEARNT